MAADPEHEKQIAARAAAELVEDGMVLGLGTGSTVKHLLPAIAARGLSGLRCVATSVATEEQARRLGLPVEPFEAIARLDLAIDGADEARPDGWLIKGGGGAHTREKVVAAAADRFVVIAGSDKAVDAFTWPVPLELLAYGLDATLRRLEHAEVREGAPLSPDGGVIADFHGGVDDPERLRAFLAGVPGVVDHGLFGPELVSDVLIARGDDVEHRTIA